MTWNYKLLNIHMEERTANKLVPTCTVSLVVLMAQGHLEPNSYVCREIHDEAHTQGLERTNKNQENKG